MPKTLILVEGKEDVEDLKQTISSIKDCKVISFDFLAHKSLNALEIPHEIVEDYFEEDDKINIDYRAIEITTTWYKNEKLREFLEYNGLNFGNVLEIELISYFFSHLKRIVGLKKVIEKENPNRIISSFLCNHVKVLCEHKQIEIEVKKPKNISSLYFDTIEIPISIGGKVLHLKISRKRFFQIKKIVEDLSNLVFNFRPDLQNRSKNLILLLDFNPMLYSDLLNALSSVSDSVILLNQRRPAIWNLRSLQVVKKSGCKVTKLEDYVTDVISSKIEKEKIVLKNKLNSLWSNNSILEETFSVDGTSFWTAIKEHFMQTINSRFEEFIWRFLLIERLFQNIKVSKILEWAHTGSEEKITRFIAQKLQIPTFLLQHALFILNPSFEKYSPFAAVLPTHGVKEAVWGEVLKNFLLQHEIRNEDILVTGSPKHDEFFRRETRTKNNGTILVTTTGFYRNNFNGTHTRAFDRLETYVKKIYEIVKKYPDKKLVVKLSTDQVYYSLKQLIHEIDPSIPVYQSQNIIDLIEPSHCVISLNYSTVLLESMILNKPAMVILPENQNFEEEIPVMKGAVVCVSKIEDLEKSLHDLISNNKIRDELILRGKEFVDEYMTNQGTASEHIAHLLK